MQNALKAKSNRTISDEFFRDTHTTNIFQREDESHRQLRNHRHQWGRYAKSFDYDAATRLSAARRGLSLPVTATPTIAAHKASPVPPPGNPTARRFALVVVFPRSIFFVFLFVLAAIYGVVIPSATHGPDQSPPKVESPQSPRAPPALRVIFPWCVLVWRTG